MRILIIKLGAIGDVLRTTSILQGLKDKYSGCSIDWITKKGSADMLKGNKFIDNVFLIDGLKDGIKGKGYDLVISLDDEDEACRIATDIGKKKVVGAYFDGDVKKYSPDSSEWFDMGLISRFGKEKADELKKENKKTYQQIISGMLGIESSELVLNLDDGELKFAEKFAEKEGIGRKDLVVGLNTGAGGRWQLKKLSSEKSARLADRLHEELNAKVVLFGGQGEKERNENIKNLAKTDIIDAGCDNSLREFASLVGLCNVLVASDSLAMNIAIALKKKVVVFFGPTSSSEIEVYNRGRKVVAPIECVCCYKKTCDVKPNCMDKLMVDDVFDSVKGCLSG
jgi:heptosyltransferase-2